MPVKMHVTKLEEQKELVSGLYQLIQLLPHVEQKPVLIFQMEHQRQHVKESLIVFLMAQIVLLKLHVLPMQTKLVVNLQELMDCAFGLIQLLQLQLESVL
jgi:hypothetical protein